MSLSNDKLNKKKLRNTCIIFIYFNMIKNLTIANVLKAPPTMVLGGILKILEKRK